MLLPPDGRLRYLYILIPNSQAPAIQSGSKSLLRVNYDDLADLIKRGIVEFPTLDDLDIADRSKANWFTKCLALCQILYFTLQLLGRAIEGLPTTTLELYTLGIVVCAMGTYAACWSKPFDIQRPVVLQARVQEFGWPESIQRSGLAEHDDTTSIFIGPVIVLLTTSFAGVHLIGWNFHFPSSVESWLWRSGSIGCALLPLLLFGLILSLDTYSKSQDRFIFLPFLFLYLIARITLLVEVFGGLRSVPVGVYQTVQWSQYFPRFG